MKHLLNDMSEMEKNSIREQHTGGMNISNKKFSKLINSKLGDVKPIKESSEMEEGFFDDIFGRPDVDRATRDSMRATGSSGRGRRDSNYGEDPKPEDEYVVFQGQQFSPDDIEYASYDDLGDLPRIENGKLIVTNPAWES